MKQFRRELKRLLPSVIFSITVFSLLVYPGVVSGDEPGELDDKLEETVQEIEQAEGEKFSTEEELEQARLREEQLAGSISYYEFQLSLAQQQLKKLGDDITEKEAAIADNLRNAQLKLEQVIGYKQNLFSQARELYKSYFANSLEIYFLTPDELEGARLMILHQAVIENLRQEVYFLNDQVKELEGERFSLEGERKNLQADRDILVDQKQETEVSIDTAQKKVLAARSDQQQLMQHLAGLGNRLQELTKKEQQILAQKAAAALAATTVGEIEITRSAIVGPPPQDSNVYFSFWTYGYPHRVGMNQYGAYGRAKAGQGYKE
ncbi:hypothetical protein KJ596_02000, partial [Patescibacteria group bacterium]|nr:hypothetical protein [Patescibacteria group bacterium]MBU1868716.1 hypothetical protein [Patescibacteria group bacterium]